MTAASSSGEEWVVEALGCDPARLADLASLRALFAAIVSELELNPVGAAQWHQFPAPAGSDVHGTGEAGGITGLLMLSESHLTIHTFPEHASACINLFCCTPRTEWSWEVRLHELLGATQVRVRHLRRDYARATAAMPAGRP